MHLAKRLFLALCVISSALQLYSQQSRIGGFCRMPYDTPKYTRPPDGMVFNSVIEARVTELFRFAR